MAAVLLHSSCTLLLLVLVRAAHSATPTNANACDELHHVFDTVPLDDNPLNSLFMHMRYVSPNNTDSPACHCRPLTPCRTIEYALYGDNTTAGDATPSDNETTPITNVTVFLGSGVHRLDCGLTLNAYQDVQFIGVDGTIIECGPEPDLENCSLKNIHICSNCSLKNIHICSSSHIYFSGITFQNCSLGPSIVVEQSDNVVFDNCTFR